ncbi:MAG: 3D domain-containing protein [Kiritimatiellaeota bacterium]|nr:3D domain-containing protein [Kiritimatiellota bacterium]
MGMLLGVLLLAGCATTGGGRRGPPPAANDPRWRTMTMTGTGYCPCGEGCNWRRTWYGRAVIASGPHAGERKAVGITASGKHAGRGTIAADTDVLAMKTQLYVPGYGYGTVEDTGGAIQGRRLDLFFSTHEQARQWGVKKLNVRVLKP